MNIYRDEFLELTREEQKKELAKRPENLRYLDDPDEEMQLIAVKTRGRVIEYITNPSASVQIASMLQNIHSIDFITNPCRECVIAAVRDNPMIYLQRFKHVPQKVLIECIKNYPSCIEYIENQTEEMQDLALNLNPWNIAYIKNATKERQLRAVRANGYVVRVIKSPSIEVILAADKRIKNQKESQLFSRESLFNLG